MRSDGGVVDRKAKGEFDDEQDRRQKYKRGKSEEESDRGTTEYNEACGEDALGGMAFEGIDKQRGCDSERGDQAGFEDGLIEQKKK